MLSFHGEEVEYDDVGLIQKANLVLKAAGLNASVISVEQLQLTIPVILVKVYEAFYGQQLEGINYTPSNRHDHENNAGIVLQALQRRYQYDSLDKITGELIVRGDRFSIETVIDVYFGIAQKIVSQREQAVDESQQSRPLQKKSKPKSPHKNSSTLSGSRSDRFYAPEQQGLIPGELKMLMERVAFLEDKLYGGRNDVSNSETIPKKRKKKKKLYSGRENTQSAAGDILNAADDEGARVNEDEKNHQTSPMSARKRNRKRPSSAPSARRPSSAPPGGRRVQRSNTNHSGRQRINEQKDDTPKAPEAGPEQSEQPKSPRKVASQYKLYTYDTWTGRKILISEVDHLQEMRRRKYAEMGLIHLDDHPATVPERKAMKERQIREALHEAPPPPTKAEYPGHRTEQSVENFVSKMKALRDPSSQADPLGFLSKARMFNSYGNLENLDIIISVEHCHNCEYHPMTLRHKTSEYESRADDVLRHLAQVAHSFRACARVGVIRFHAAITPKCRSTDLHTRIGALEVQVAYRSHTGRIIAELLHSKLKTRRWPSKVVLEKRMKSFLSQSGVQSHRDKSGDTFEETVHDVGLAPYPVGGGDWTQVPLSDKLWKYVPRKQESGVKYSVMDSVQWAFDSRMFYHHQKYSIGSTVNVYHVENEYNGVEDYAMVGVIKRSFKDEDTNCDMFAVRLKYHDMESDCPSCNCFKPNDETEIMNHESTCDRSHKTSTVVESWSGTPLPPPLHTVLNFAHSEGLIDWREMSPDDRMVVTEQNHKEYHLCRASYFHQIRELVWKGIHSQGGDEYGTMRDLSTGDTNVPVQLAYSEPYIDWVFNKFGSLVNMSDLLKTAGVVEGTRNQISSISSETCAAENTPKEQETEEAASGSVRDKTFVAPVCDSNHDLALSEFAEGEYINGFTCNMCKVNGKGMRWFCELCMYDICLTCCKPPVKITSPNRKKVMRAISKVVEDTDDTAGSISADMDVTSAVMSLRKKIQNVCLSLVPPAEGSPESTESGNKIDHSKYKDGAKLIFDALDKDQSGELNMSEFNNALIQFDIECNDDELQKLWATLDIDGNSQISLPELLSFLHFNAKVGYRELGEIWSTIREATGATFDGEDVEDEGHSILEEMEKDMFSMCDILDGVGNVISATVFIKILDKFSLMRILKPHDTRILLAYFGVDKGGNPIADTILADTSTDAEVESCFVKFDDFFSWLQPVDFVKVCKRITRFLKACAHSELMSLSHKSRLILSGTHTVGSNGGGPSSSREKRVVVHHDSVNMNSQIALTVRQCPSEHKDTFQFETCRLDSTSFELLTIRTDVEHGWGQNLLVEWKFECQDVDISGIPASAVDPEMTGVVTKYNFQAFIDNMGLPINSAELRSLFRNFGQEDGETMTYEQLHQMVNCTTMSHKFVPLIGSRSYRKKSIVAGSEIFGPTQGSISEDALYTDDFCEEPIADEVVEIGIALIELEGNALIGQSMLLEMKYLLQELSVNIDAKRKPQRVLDDLDWEPILLTPSALKMNADVCVKLVIGKDMTSSGFFSPRKMMRSERNELIIIPLHLTFPNSEKVNVNIHCRIREASKNRSMRINRMNTSDLMCVPSEPIIDNDDNDDDLYADDYHREDDHIEFLAGFESTKPSPRGESPNPMSGNEENVSPPRKEDSEPNGELYDTETFEPDVEVDCSGDSAKKSSDIDPSQIYSVGLRKVVTNRLTNVERFGSNDPFVVLRFGSLWVHRTPTHQDTAGSSTWLYYDGDVDAVEVSGSTLYEESLSVAVYDDNSVSKPTLIGRSSCKLTSQDSFVVQIQSDEGEPSGEVELEFQFKVVNTNKDDDESRAICLSAMHFTLDSEEFRKRNCHARLELDEWVHTTETKVCMNGQCSWDDLAVIQEFGYATVRRNPLHVKIFVEKATSEHLLAHGMVNIQRVFTEESSHSHTLHFGFDTVDYDSHKNGRIILAAYTNHAAPENVGRVEDQLGIAKTDKDILLDVFESTGGRSWFDTCFWSKDVELTGWTNINLDAHNERVTAIWLGSNGLSGQIPPQLHLLDRLTELELFANSLSGNIPPEIGELTHLRTLFLNSNSLTGPIPDSLSQCINLEEIDFSSNMLTGKIPSGMAIKRLTSVDLSNNMLDGPVPVSFCECKALGKFLCDLIPYEEENFYKVYDWIEAHHDELTAANEGNIDDSYGAEGQAMIRSVKLNLSLLSRDLESSDNCFAKWDVDGDIRSWNGVVIDNQGNLRSLNLCDTSLYGPLPSHLELFTSIVYLDFSNNELDGFLPHELTNLPNLKYLFLNNNKFEGPLPDDIRMLSKLRTLHLGANQLTGYIPLELSGLKNLQTFDISQNRLEGPIPDELMMLSNLTNLDVSDNSLTGPIPDVSGLLAIEHLSVAKNQLTGHLPETIGSITTLRKLDISFTSLTGKIPHSLSNLIHLEEMQIQLTNLDLGDMDPSISKKVIMKRVPSLRKLSL